MTQAGPLDVLGFIGRNQTFDDLSSAVEHMEIGTLTVPVLSLDELIAQKEMSGRDKDQPMLRLLRAAREKLKQR